MILIRSRSTEDLCKNSVLLNFKRFTQHHLSRSPLLKRLRGRHFPANCLTKPKKNCMTDNFWRILQNFTTIQYPLGFCHIFSHQVNETKLTKSKISKISKLKSLWQEWIVTFFCKLRPNVMIQFPILHSLGAKLFINKGEVYSYYYYYYYYYY